MKRERDARSERERGGDREGEEGRERKGMNIINLTRWC